MATTQFYAGEGYGYVQVNNASWDTAHDASSGLAVSDGSGTWCQTLRHNASGTFYFTRHFFPFDTSDIGAGSTITSASLNFYVDSVEDDKNDAYSYMASVQTTQASTSTLVDGDYDQCGSVDNPTQGGSKDLTSITGSQYNNIALNSTGRGWINKSGYTKLGMREGHDCEDVQIATSGQVRCGVDIRGDDETNPPYLEVTYSLAMTAEVGEFVLTGNDVDFIKNTTMTAEVGTFVLTGNDVDFIAPEAVMTAEVGEFVLTGNDVDFIKNTTMIAETGTFVLTGNDVRFKCPIVWNNATKNTSSLSNATKNTSSWNNEYKS